MSTNNNTDNKPEEIKSSEEARQEKDKGDSRRSLLKTATMGKETTTRKNSRV